MSQEVYDPTELLRRGERSPDARYMAEVIYRNSLEGAVKSLEVLAKEAIWAACVFEQQWFIAAMPEPRVASIVSEDVVLIEKGLEAK